MHNSYFLPLLVLGLILLGLIVTYNGFVKLKNIVKEAFATMDVYLKKRWDLIPNIIESVKGYAEHEKTVFENVVNLRNKAYGQMTQEEKIEANQQMTSALSKLMAVAESYPDLKANTLFLDLNAQLNQVEADIANARKYYNAVVRDFNTKTETFPSNIIAGIFGFKPQSMFEISEDERNNVKVQF